MNAAPTAAGNLPATGGAQAALAPTTGAAASQAAVAARNGRRWYKADLHTHTPASNDYEQPGVTYLEWLRTAAERGLDIVAVTDHNTVAGVAAIRREIEWLIRLKEQGRLTENERQTLAEWSDLSNRVLVLPGFEFTATFGFHILGIFPPATSIRTLEHILLTLKVPPDKLDIGSTETGSTTDVLNAYKVIREYGGLAIAAHANSTHGVAMRNFPFGGQTKIAYTQDPNLDALEVTDLENRAHSTARFFNGTKSEYPRRMHALQGSDAHRLTMDPRNPKRLGIGERATELMLDEPSFEALAALLRSPQWDRTRPARPKDRPMDPLATAREEGNTALQSLHDSATKQGGKLDAVLADLCAFANSAGGTVYVGMSLRRDGPRALARPKPVEDLLVESVETRLTPPIELQIDTVPVEGGGVLRLRVARGEERPYAVDAQRIYVRSEATSTVATRDEIVAMVLEGAGLGMLDAQAGRPERSDSGAERRPAGLSAPVKASPTQAGSAQAGQAEANGGRQSSRTTDGRAQQGAGQPARDGRSQAGAGRAQPAQTGRGRQQPKPLQESDPTQGPASTPLVPGARPMQAPTVAPVLAVSPTQVPAPATPEVENPLTAAPLHEQAPTAPPVRTPARRGRPAKAPVVPQPNAEEVAGNPDAAATQTPVREELPPADAVAIAAEVSTSVAPLPAPEAPAHVELAAEPPPVAKPARSRSKKVAATVPAAPSADGGDAGRPLPPEPGTGDEPVVPAILAPVMDSAPVTASKSTRSRSSAKAKSAVVPAPETAVEPAQELGATAIVPAEPTQTAADGAVAAVKAPVKRTRKSSAKSAPPAALEAAVPAEGAMAQPNVAESFQGDDVNDAFHAPQIGVEIIESELRNGVRVHTIRDLRNGNTVRNVSRKGARDLWSYAITRHEDRPLDPETVSWVGNIALLHAEKRAGKVRYDLALREGDAVRVFYGVTADGMEGRWSRFLQEEG